MGDPSSLVIIAGVSETPPVIPPRPPAEPRWKVWGCLALLLVGLYLVGGPKVRFSEWIVTRGRNAAMEEALQWKRGTLVLSDANPHREAPEVDGKRYNVVGLPFVLISLVGTTLTEWFGGPPETFYTPYYVALVGLPLPFVGFWAFRRMVASSAWAAVLTAYLMLGTCLLPVLGVCGQGSLYHINHALAVTGLLVMAADLLGDRRIWPAVLGLGLAVWSRQMTCLYALPLLWIAYDRARSSPRSAAPVAPDPPATPHAGDGAALHGLHSPPKRRSLQMAVVGIALIAAVPLTLNAIKFGNPLDTGYLRMYAGRTDPIGLKAQECFFGPRYVFEHAWAMNLSLPRWDVRAGTLYPDASGINGASIWFTSPLLFGVFLSARRWWHDPRRRALMLTSLVVIAGLWCYHTTAAYDTPYYRYALDFIPVWLIVIAPYTNGPRARLWTLACLAFSALYFNLLP